MLIKNGFLLDPASGRSGHFDIRIQSETIIEIGEELAPNNEEQIIDATGLSVAPGLIDTHIHFRDPGFTYKEDLHTGSLSAAAGGFTSVICMANTSPVVDNADTLKDIVERAKNENIHIYQAAAVSHKLRGEELTNMEELKDLGACGFTDDGIPLKNAAFLLHAMNEAKRLDVPISLHEEDPTFIKNNGVNHGPVSEQLGIYGSPSIAEESLVSRDCMIALESGADVVMQHISSGKSVEIIRHFKELGANIHTEATPHHFTLTDEAVLKYGTLAKMNPPLRTEKDRQEIIAGLADGTIDIIATDHAPHSKEEKERSITAAPSGIIGLETALALGITSLVREGHLTLMQLLEKMTINPAKLYHLNAGAISVGAPADLVLFNPNEEWTPKTYMSKSSNSPFTGWNLFGKVKMTISNGKVVFNDSDHQ